MQKQIQIESNSEQVSMKLCSRCKKIKALVLFKIERQNIDGRCGMCKECSNLVSKIYKEKIKEGTIKAF